MLFENLVKNIKIKNAIPKKTFFKLINFFIRGRSSDHGNYNFGMVFGSNSGYMNVS